LTFWGQFSGFWTFLGPLRACPAEAEGAEPNSPRHTGDGKIFVVIDLVDCIRIRTGEDGREAIG